VYESLSTHTQSYLHDDTMFKKIVQCLDESCISFFIKSCMQCLICILDISMVCGFHLPVVSF
jgi:hypothetical protein